MKVKHIILSMALLSSIGVQAQQALYVSVNGQKGASGSQTEPLSSVGEALKRVKQLTGTDTVYVKVASGTYHMERPLVWTEADTRPVVIEGYGATKPVLSGGIAIAGWEELPNGLWKCTVPEVVHYGVNFEQLYVNGKRATRARTPDTGWFHLEGSSEIVHHKGAGRVADFASQQLRAKPADLVSLKGLDFKKAQVSALFYHKWDNTRKRLDFVQPDSGLICIQGTGMKPWNPIKKGNRFVLENYKSALTVAGEWFLDTTGELYYMPKPDEKIETTTCFAPMLPQLVQLKGTAAKPVQGKVLRNLSLAHTAHRMPIHGNEAQQAAASVDAVVMADFAERIVIEDCEIQHTGNYAIWLRESCSNSIIRHNYLNDLGAGGIKVGDAVQTDNQSFTHDILVENNIITQTGWIYPCGVGIAIFHAYNNKVLHNEIFDLRYSAISVGWVWGYASSPAHHNEIAYNHLHHIGWGELSDMGAVYTLGISPGTHIHHNVIHDVYSYDYGGWGLYTDEGSTGVVMENNLVYACKSGGFHQHYGKDNIIRNNIFAFGHYYQAQFTRVESHRSLSFTNNILYMDCGVLLSGAWDKAKIDLERNCYWDARGKDSIRVLGKSWDVWKKDVKKDKGSIVANPYFTDPLNGDFSFKSKRTIRKIGFIPFCTDQVGVYGTADWKSKAEMPAQVKAAFRQVILNREKTHSAYYK